MKTNPFAKVAITTIVAIAAIFWGDCRSASGRPIITTPIATALVVNIPPPGTVPPPAPPTQIATPAPGPNYVWTPGFWSWNGVTWIWIPGQWVIRPWPRAIWAGPRWVEHGRHWAWERGRWR